MLVTLNKIKKLINISKIYTKRYCDLPKMSESECGITLQKLVAELDDLAPLRFAEKWDNVGLLVEPSTPRSIQTIFLTNDLTEAVLKEALNVKSDLIISYHPPIFAPLRRITQSNWKEKIISICLENRIAIYSPHTSWDFAKNGVNDWLASSLPYSKIEPIEKVPDQQGGMGRLLNLREGMTLKKAIDGVKTQIGLKDIRVALGKNSDLDSEIKTAAVCAGSGSSILCKIKADLYLTGEMSHHEILNATQNNISVILCNHSNSERGYLDKFKCILEQVLGGKVNIIVSKVDTDPLATY